MEQGTGTRDQGLGTGQRVDDLLHRKIVHACKKSTAICLQKLRKGSPGRLWVERRTKKVPKSTAVGVPKKTGITHGSNTKVWNKAKLRRF
jgi:hypothetical protein